MAFHGGVFSGTYSGCLFNVKVIVMKTWILTAALLPLPLLQGCTVLAIADVAASTVIYGVKTVVNVVDAVTPDIINKDKDKKKN